MEPNKQDIRLQMAVAYLNNLKVREAKIMKTLRDIQSEINVCAKAMEQDE